MEISNQPSWHDYGNFLHLRCIRRHLPGLLACLSSVLRGIPQAFEADMIGSVTLGDNGIWEDRGRQFSWMVNLSA